MFFCPPPSTDPTFTTPNHPHTNQPPPHSLRNNALLALADVARTHTQAVEPHVEALTARCADEHVVVCAGDSMRRGTI